MKIFFKLIHSKWDCFKKIVIVNLSPNLKTSINHYCCSRWPNAEEFAFFCNGTFYSSLCCYGTFGTRRDKLCHYKYQTVNVWKNIIFFDVLNFWLKEFSAALFTVTSVQHKGLKHLDKPKISLHMLLHTTRTL